MIDHGEESRSGRGISCMHTLSSMVVLLSLLLFSNTMCLMNIITPTKAGARLNATDLVSWRQVCAKEGAYFVDEPNSTLPPCFRSSGMAESTLTRSKSKSMSRTTSRNMNAFDMKQLDVSLDHYNVQTRSFFPLPPPTVVCVFDNPGYWKHRILKMRTHARPRRSRS